MLRFANTSPHHFFAEHREERIEDSGPLGKEHVANKEIEAVEAELRLARQHGTADAFALYLYGLVLIDK